MSCERYTGKARSINPAKNRVTIKRSLLDDSKLTAWRTRHYDNNSKLRDILK